MSLSVCLVTRNHERSLGRAIRSVDGVAGEVIVVDTGSTDGTVAVAGQAGARVLPYQWQEDFAAACNFALDHAAGDWVLWLNPDEELVQAAKERIPGYLTVDAALAYTVRVRQQVREEPAGYGVDTVEVRLFRRLPEVRYRGRLHPAFDPPLPEVSSRRGQHVYGSDLSLRRHAYLSTLSPDKLRWSARLLELELRDRPGQLHYLIEYGRTLLWLNDPKGHAVLAEAVEALRPRLGDPVPPTPNTGSLVEYLITVSPAQLQARISRDEVQELAGRWFRHSPPVVWALAGELFKAGNYREAASRLEELLEMGRTGSFDRSAGFAPEVVGASALMNLGVCLARLGEFDRAEQCFGQLFGDPAFKDKARQGYALVQSLRAGRPVASDTTVSSPSQDSAG